MSKYSDHTTVGGQVLAHRVRMMKQNWNIIWIVGRVGFLLSFLFYAMFKYKINDIWNYLCIVKAVYRDNMTALPSSLFSSSHLWFKSGRWKELSDHLIATSEEFLIVKAQIESDLWFALKLAVCIGIASMVLMVILNKYFGKSLSDKKELISGHDYADAKTLTKIIKHKSDITLASIPYPQGAEYRHTILTGTTGSGKTNVMIELLDQLVNKGERIVIVDTVGTYVNRYYKKGRDIILNPFSREGVPWSFLNECATKDKSLNDTLIKNVADCLIDNGTNGNFDSFWDEAARIVFSETVKKAIQDGITTAELLELLLKIPLSEIEKYLEGTYASTILDSQAEKMAISIRAILTNSVSVFDIFHEESENNFSIRNWIYSKDLYPRNGGILFLSCKPVERSAMIPIITSWLSIASDAMLHTSPTSKRTWFFIDELHNLKRLPKIETSLAEIRKYGGCFVIGTQMVAQLNKLYGYEVTKTIVGLCGTKIVMGIPEPETAKYMSRFLGEKEEISTSEAISYGANTMRDGVNIAQKTERKQTVPYGEIMNLKPGEAFIKFSGIDLIAKAKFKLHA